MKKTIVMAVLGIVLSTHVYGAEIKYGYDMENDIIKISGSVDAAGEAVSFQLYSKNENFDGIVTNVNIPDMLVFSGQQYAGDDKSFAFEFQLKENSGNYLARVGAESLEDALETEFYYSNPEELKKIYDNIIQKNTVSELMTYVEENFEVFNVNEDEYNLLNKKENVYSFLLEEKAYTSFGEFTGKLDAFISIQYINEVTDTNVLLQKLSGYSEITDSTWYKETFETLSEEQKKNVLENLALGADVKTILEVKNAFMNEIFKAVVLNNNWMSICVALEDNADMFSDCIKNTEDREKAAKAIAGKSYNSVADMKQAINTALTFKQPVIIQGSSGGSSGGGGSKISAPSVLPPKVEAEVKPVPIEEKDAPFLDMESFEWAENAVTDLWRDNVINGVSETEFAPQKSVTREEFVTMIVKNFGFYNEKEECDFNDVNKNDWCYPAVASALKNEIIFGIDENNFGKGEKITREDMCVIACRAAEKAGITFEDGEEVVFNDEISDYAKADIQKMCSAKVLSGMGDGYFGAKNPANRAQAALVIYNINKYADEEGK